MNRTLRLSLVTLAVPILAQATVWAQSSETWSGFATVHNQQVPVHLVLSSSSKDGAVAGSFVNALQKAPSSSGELKDHHLTLNFDYYARKLEGDFQQDAFTGKYGGERGEASAIELHRDHHAQAPTASADVSAHNKAIRGDWELAVQSAKGESAWTLRISTSAIPGEIKAVILKVDGDTNALYGEYNAATSEYEVSHFSAAGPAFYTFKQQADGTLLVTNPLRDGQQWTARRPDQARKEHLAPPTNATQQTSVVDATKPFHFSAPDLAGKTVSNSDARFRGKVVIVAIGGSWCPNCHDEAPFLADLYNRYHARGLEIVNISFEEEGQLKDPRRLKAFVAKYHLPYTVLLGGTPAEVNEKLPQGKNLNCWPTTFFLGRNGRVQEVHAGFSGPETGAAYTQLKGETDKLLNKLLGEREVASR